MQSGLIKKRTKFHPSKSPSSFFSSCYSAINPILYNAMSDKFRKAFRREISCGKLQEPAHNHIFCYNQEVAGAGGAGGQPRRAPLRTQSQRRASPAVESDQNASSAGVSSSISPAARHRATLHSVPSSASFSGLNAAHAEAAASEGNGPSGLLLTPAWRPSVASEGADRHLPRCSRHLRVSVATQAGGRAGGGGGGGLHNSSSCAPPSSSSSSSKAAPLHRLTARSSPQSEDMTTNITTTTTTSF